MHLRKFQKPRIENFPYFIQQSITVNQYFFLFVIQLKQIDFSVHILNILFKIFSVFYSLLKKLDSYTLFRFLLHFNELVFYRSLQNIVEAKLF